MQQLSNSDIESICEVAYNHVVNSWCNLDLLDSENAFVDNSQGNFNSMTYPQLANRITQVQGNILYKWKEKLSGEARRWYDDKARRQKDSENCKANCQDEEIEEDYEIRAEQEKKRRQAENAAKRKSEILSGTKGRVSNDDVFEALGGKDSIKAIKFLEEQARLEQMDAEDAYKDYLRRTTPASRDLEILRKLENRYEATEKKWLALYDLLSTKEREEEKRVAAQRKVEEEAKRKELAEKAEQKRQEEARRVAELAAKRQTQDEANRRQLDEIQSKCRSNQSKGSSVVTPYDTVPCPQCGTQIKRDSKFCTSCGTKLLAACANCGAYIKVSSKFCTNCGTPVSK